MDPDETVSLRLYMEKMRQFHQDFTWKSFHYAEEINRMYISLSKHFEPWVVPFLAPGAEFKQLWWRFTTCRLCYIPNIKALGLVVYDKNFSSIFFYI